MELNSKNQSEILNHPAWPTKVAFYLTHCVDGGILCSQFTLETLIKLLRNVTEAKDEAAVKQELSYLLNARKKRLKYDRL